MVIFLKLLLSEGLLGFCFYSVNLGQQWPSSQKRNTLEKRNMSEIHSVPPWGPPVSFEIGVSQAHASNPMLGEVLDSRRY